MEKLSHHLALENSKLVLSGLAHKEKQQTAPKDRCVVIIALGREISPFYFKCEGSNQKKTTAPNYRCVVRIALGSAISPLTFKGEWSNRKNNSANISLCRDNRVRARNFAFIVLRRGVQPKNIVA